MSKILIDTNILIYAMDVESKYNQVALQFFQKIENKEIEVFISERSLYELVAVFTSPAFVNKMNLEN